MRPWLAAALALSVPLAVRAADEPLPAGAGAAPAAVAPAPAPAPAPGPWDPAKLPPELRKLGFTDADWEEVRDREVAVHSETFKTQGGADAARAYAGVIINKPWEVCFDTVYDYGKTPEYLPRVSTVQILSKYPDRLRVHQTISVLTTTVQYTMWFHFDRAGKKIAYKLDPKGTNEITDTEGVWLFVPLPDGTTFLRYSVFADTGVAVPGFVADFLTRSDLPDILENFRKRVESGGRWTL